MMGSRSELSIDAYSTDVGEPAFESTSTTWLKGLIPIEEVSISYAATIPTEVESSVSDLEPGSVRWSEYIENRIRTLAQQPESRTVMTSDNERTIRKIFEFTFRYLSQGTPTPSVSFEYPDSIELYWLKRGWRVVVRFSEEETWVCGIQTNTSNFFAGDISDPRVVQSLEEFVAAISESTDAGDATTS